MGEDALRGRIIAKFRYVKRFADAVGWSTRKAYDIVNGKQELTATDIDEICAALEIEIPEDLRILIFH